MLGSSAGLKRLADLWLSAKLWLRGLVKSKRMPSKKSGFSDTAGGC